MKAFCSLLLLAFAVQHVPTGTNAADEPSQPADSGQQPESNGELPVVHVYANGVRDNARVSQGRFVPLECRVLPVHEAETLSFSWRRSDGHGLPADRLFDLVSDGSSILLYDVQVEDSSTYTCSVETGSGKTGAGSILLEVESTQSRGAVTSANSSILTTMPTPATAPITANTDEAVWLAATSLVVAVKENGTALLRCQQPRSSHIVSDMTFSRLDSKAIRPEYFNVSTIAGHADTTITTTFVLSNMRPSDGGTYVCAVAMSKDTIEVASVVLVGDFSTEVFHAPLNITSDTHAASFTMEYRIPTLPLYDHWMVGAVDVPYKHSRDALELTLPDNLSYRFRVNLTAADGSPIKSAVYTLGARYVQPTTTTIPTTSTSLVEPIVSVTVSPSPVKLDGVVMFQCKVNYSEPFVIHWERASGVELPLGRHSQSGNMLEIFTVYNVVADDDDIYICSVQTESGRTVSSSARLLFDSTSVLPTPPRPSPSPIILFDIPVAVAEVRMLRGVGEFARFRCRYDHSQLPRDVLSVFWLHDSQRFHMTGRHQLSRNNLTLRLENVQLADAGRWTCVVSAVVAQGQASLVLHVGNDVPGRDQAVITSREGAFHKPFFSAYWAVNMTSRSVQVSLSTPLAHQWLAFGVSNDKGMAESDIIMGYLDGRGVPVVEDRWAVYHATPALDPSQDIADVTGSRNASLTSLSFSLPCASSDLFDLPLSGRHYFLFAHGELGDGVFHQHHLNSRWVTDGIISIDCGDTIETLRTTTERPTVAVHALEEATVSTTARAESPTEALVLCSINGFDLQPGEELDVNLCTTCQCTADGRTNCSTQTCPVLLCATPIVTSTRCCPQCPAKEIPNAVASVPSCSSGQAECRMIQQCIPLAAVCDMKVDCLDGSDEESCGDSDVSVTFSTDPEDTSAAARAESSSTYSAVPGVFVTRNASATLECIASRSVKSVSWYKYNQRIASSGNIVVAEYDNLVAKGSRLTILNADEWDTGIYYCTVSSSRQSASYHRHLHILGNDGQVISPRCDNDKNKAGYSVHSSWRELRPQAGDTRKSVAAQILFVVDESRSMVDEHSWLKDFTLGLESALQALDFGALDSKNMYGLVGFGGRDKSPLGWLGRTVSSSLGKTMVNSDQFVSELLPQLLDNGAFEDGYSAINTALESNADSFSPDSAKLLFLVTDEGRDKLAWYLTRDMLAESLKELGFVMHAVSSVSLGLAGSQPILGIKQDREFFQDPLAHDSVASRLLTGPVQFTSRPTAYRTWEDYAVLALLTGGTVWDIEQLRLGYRERAVLSQALTHAAVSIAADQALVCHECHCTVNGSTACTTAAIQPYHCLSAPASLIAPRIKLSKAYIVAEIYETVQLDCIALQGKPEPASYSWQHDNGSSRVDLRIADPTLRLENVSFESTGRYICYVETEGGLAEAHAQLVVHASPRFTASGAGQVDATIGSNVSISAHAHGFPSPQIAWWYERIGGSLPSSVHQVGHAITFPVVSPEQYGTYYATAINARGHDIKSLKLTGSRPVKVLIEPAELDLPTNTPATLTCIVLGQPEALVKWTWNSSDSAGSLAQSQQPRSDGNILHIPAVQHGLMFITCSPVYRDGKTPGDVNSATARITRKGGISIKVFPEDLHLQAGDSADILCSVFGTIAEEVSWSFALGASGELPDGVTVVGGTKLQVMNVSVNLVGEYLCTASVAGRVVTATAHLQIKGAPSQPLVDPEMIYTGEAHQVLIPLPHSTRMADITHYSLLYRKKAPGIHSMHWLKHRNTAPVNAEIFALDGLQSGQDYEIRWQAHSPLGVSLPSTLQSVKTCQKGAAVWPLPSSYPFLSTPRSVTLGVPFLSNPAGENPITVDTIRVSYGYASNLTTDVQWMAKEDIRALQTNTSTFNVHGLRPETRYAIRICAVSTGGSCSPWSLPVYVWTIHEDAIPWTQPPVVLGQTTPSSILFNVPTLGNLDRGNVTRLGLAYRFLGSSTSMWSDVLFGHVTYPSPAGRGQDDVMRLFNLEPGTLYSVYLYNVSQGQHSPLSQSVIVSTLPADFPYWPSFEDVLVPATRDSVVLQSPIGRWSNLPRRFSLMARRYEKLLISWTDWQPVDYDFADLTQQAVRLSGLIPSTRYEVRVHQYAGQPGMIGHIISVETGEDTNDLPSVDVIRHKITSNSVTLLLPASLKDRHEDLLLIIHVVKTDQVDSPELHGEIPLVLGRDIMTIEDLKPGLKYVIHVETKADPGHRLHTSSHLVVNTLPSGSPLWSDEFDDIIDVEVTSAVIPTPMLEGPLSQSASYSLYMRHYREEALIWSEWQLYTNANGLSYRYRSALVSDLTADTRYEFYWIDRRGAGTSARTSTVAIRTLSSEQQLWPYPAMDFSFLSTSSARLSLPRMAVISWPTDVVLRYRYSNPAGDLTPWLEQRNLSVHDTNNPSVQVTGLPSSQPIQVQLINMALSPPVVSSLLSFRTLEAGAPIWPHNAYTMSDSTLTSVTFAPPVSSHTSPEELLIVSLQLLSDKHELVKETTVPWSKQTVIHALQPSSSYRLRVRYPMTPFSTAITVRTLAVGAPLWPNGAVHRSSIGPHSAVVALPSVLALGNDNIPARRFFDKWLVYYSVDRHTTAMSATRPIFNSELLHQDTLSHVVQLNRLLPSTQYYLSVQGYNSSSGYKSPVSVLLGFETTTPESPYWQHYPISRSRLSSSSVAIYPPMQSQQGSRQNISSEEFALRVWKVRNGSGKASYIESSATVNRDGFLVLAGLQSETLYAVTVRYSSSSFWTPRVLVRTLTPGVLQWPSDGFLLHHALPSKAVLHLPEVAFSVGRWVNLVVTPVSDAVGRWSTHPQFSFQRNISVPDDHTYIVLPGLSSSSAYYVVARWSSPLNLQVFQTTKLLVVTSTPDAPVWPAPPQLHHRSTPSSISLNLPESTSVESSPKDFHVRYRELLDYGMVREWKNWPEQVPSGRSDVLITDLQPRRGYEFEVCYLSQRAVPLLCSMPYSVTTQLAGTPRWAPEPYDPVTLTHSTVMLSTPYMEGDNTRVDIFVIDVRFARDVVAGRVFVWSSWVRLPVTLDASRDFRRTMLLRDLPRGKDGFIQLRVRAEWRPTSSASSPSSTVSPWTPPLHIQLPVMTSPLWPPGAFPTDGVSNDSIVVGLPTDLPPTATNYKLLVRHRNADLSWTPWEGVVNDDKDNSVLKLTGLQSNSTYQVKVQYVNNSYASSLSSTVQLHTLPSGRPISPPRPSVLPFNDTGLVSLALPWQYYSNRSIAISRVVVQYREVLSPGHFGPYRQIHGSIEQEKVDLVDATPNTRYEIVTIAVNEDGSSVPSHPTYSLTPDVFSPRQPVVRFASGRTSSTIALRIPGLVAYPALYPVTAIRIRHAIAGSRYFHTGPDIDLQKQSTEVSISSLQPNTTYQFQIQAIGAGGISPWSNISMANTLRPGDAVQPHAPTLLHGQSADTLLVVLPSPQSHHPHHQPLRYHIAYAAQNGDGTWPLLSDMSMTSTVPGMLWMTLHDLQKATAYRVQIRTTSYNGVSKWSPYSVATTLYAGIIPPIRLPSIVFTTQHTVVFDLTYLLKYNQTSGRVHQAIVRVIPASLNPSQVAHRVLTIDDFAASLVSIPNLNPNTTYSAQWKLSGGAQEREAWRGAQFFTTQSYLPPIPQAPAVQPTFITRTAAIISLPFADPLRDTLHYVKLCKFSRGECDHQPSEFKISYPSTASTVSGLESDTFYYAWLVASNSHGESSGGAKTAFRTLQPGEPMAPPAPSIGYNATSYSIPLVLLVDHPLISHDDYVPVSFYQLAVRQPVATQWRVAATDIPAVNGKIVDGAYTYDEDGAQLRGQFAFRLRAVSSSGVMSSWGPELETETLHQGLPVTPSTPLVNTLDKGSTLIISSGFFSKSIHGHPVDYFNISVEEILDKSESENVPDKFFVQVPHGDNGTTVTVKGNYRYRVCVSAVNTLSSSPFGPCYGADSAPYIINEHDLPSSVTAIAGSDVRLICPVGGAPPVQRLWHRVDGKAFLAGTGRIHSTLDGSGLLLSAAQLSDAGTYVCHAGNEHGKLSLEIRLQVTSAEYCKHQKQTIPAGESRQFLSEWSTLPEMDVVFAVGQLPSAANYQKQLSSLPGTMRLTLSNVSREHFNTSVNGVNRFGLLAFGGAGHDLGFGRPLRMPSTDVWGDDREFKMAVQLLKSDSLYADGYHALRMALQAYSYRCSAPCHLVLVTDRSRGKLYPPITDVQLLESIRLSKCYVHVITLEAMNGLGFGSRENVSMEMFGLTQSGTAYYYTPNQAAASTETIALPTNLPDGSYARLAFGLKGGSMWHVDSDLPWNVLAGAVSQHVASVTLQELCEECTCRVDGSVACVACL